MNATEIPAAGEDAAGRVAAFDWQRVERDLDECGYAAVKDLMSGRECDALADLYRADEAFRSRVVMARHGFGRGEFRYFDYPLPAPVARLRVAPVA